MDIVREAFNQLYPEKPYTFTAEIKYSGKFNGYNARIQLQRFTKHIVFSLSRNWETVERDIQVGLVQHLLCRLFKDKRHTTQMDLYQYFMKSVPNTVAKTKTHPVLEESFTRVNDQFFSGLLDRPNLVVGNGVTKLGHYEMGTDTVNISTILMEHSELMDYVMYHELLHKKHQFTGKGGSHRFHTAAFRADERKFPDAPRLEKELSRLVSGVKRGSFFGWF
jgi:hypothetical protein